MLLTATWFVAVSKKNATLFVVQSVSFVLPDHFSNSWLVKLQKELRYSCTDASHAIEEIQRREFVLRSYNHARLGVHRVWRPRWQSVVPKCQQPWLRFPVLLGFRDYILNSTTLHIYLLVNGSVILRPGQFPHRLHGI